MNLHSIALIKLQVMQTSSNALQFVPTGGVSRRVAIFLPESKTFHIKSKEIKMLSCENFASLLDPPLPKLKSRKKEKEKHNKKNINYY